MRKMWKRASLLSGLCLVGAGAGSASAGLVVSTYADQPTFNGVPALETTATPQASDTVNQQCASGISQAQTIVTDVSGFQLDRIEIYSGGKGGGTGTLNIYPNPVGGGDSDGFVNTSFSTDLLNGGAGLPFTFNGSGGAQYLVLDLTGPDEITLAPSTKYAIEIDVTGSTSQWSWLRSSAGTYPNGNLYQGASELNFNGTPPANGRGERDQVGGTPQRDGGMALFAVGVPEPTSLGLMGVAAVGLIARRRRNHA